MFEDDEDDDLPKAPGRNAGETNPETKRTRAPIILTEEQRRHARYLRFEQKWDWAQLADTFGCSVPEMQHALATLRTPTRQPKRATANISLAAHAAIQKQRLGDEPIWQTMNRILGID